MEIQVSFQSWFPALIGQKPTLHWPGVWQGQSRGPELKEERTSGAAGGEHPGPPQWPSPLPGLLVTSLTGSFSPRLPGCWVNTGPTEAEEWVSCQQRLRPESLPDHCLRGVGSHSWSGQLCPCRVAPTWAMNTSLVFLTFRGSLPPHAGFQDTTERLKPHPYPGELCPPPSRKPRSPGLLSLDCAQSWTLASGTLFHLQQ